MKDHERCTHVVLTKQPIGSGGLGYMRCRQWRWKAAGTSTCWVHSSFFVRLRMLKVAE